MISRLSVNGRYPVSRLGEVVDFLDSQRKPVTESDRKPGPYPYFGANGQQGTIDGFLFDEPLVLLAEDGGHFETPDRGIAYRISGKTWVNNHAHVLRPKPQVNLDYLCRVLENYDVTPFVTGTTRGKLTKGGAQEIPIPLPPLPEQRRIAAILDKADDLRAKRQETLEQLNVLTQSVFLDMFGDPARNPKRFPQASLGDLAERFSDGPFGSHLKTSHYTDSGVRVIRLQNIGVGEFLDADRAFVSAAHFSMLKRHETLPGDILIGTLGDPNLRACIQPDWLSVAINKADCVQMRPDERRANAEYLCALLNHPSTARMAERLTLGQTRLRISMGRLRGLAVPVPPLGMQVAFANQIHRAQKLRRQHLTFVSEADRLFASLQHQAFSGAL